MINENDCGITVPPENPGAFADALVYLRDNPDRKAEMGHNARVLAESEFNRKNLADQFVSFLEKTNEIVGDHETTR